MDLFEQQSAFEFGKLPSEEPIGIVISRGAAVEASPRLRAYVWGEAPAVDTEPVRVKSS